MAVKVATLENEIQLKIEHKKRAMEFFTTVSRNLGIHETWFFGILYKDAENEDVWIDGSKKSLKHFKNYLHALKYRVKFFPEDVEIELLEEITVRYFFLQVKAAILQDAIYCPPDTCVLLASYVLQAKHGDYSENVDTEIFSKQGLLPERVYKQHNLEKDAWNDNIINLWKKHKGMIREDAMLEYLKLSQNLEMYGVTYFDIRNKKGTPLLLGVTALGLNIYHPKDKLNPTIAFPWSEIQNISFRDKKFSIKQTDKKSEGFVFFVSDAKINKTILNLGVGNHSLYIRRRKPDSLELLQMKTRAAEMKKGRLQQNEKLQSEVLARQQAEEKEKQYKEEIQSLKEEMEKHQARLQEAQKTIQSLREQLEDVNKAKENLEAQQQELREMMQRLENSKSMETLERQKLEEEITTKQLEVQKIQEEVRLKNEETSRLQTLVDLAQKREAEILQQKIVQNGYKETENNHKDVPIENNNPINDDLPKIVTVNEDIQEQLKKLQMQLEQTRDASKDTEMDRIHRENLKEGRNKYKTLMEIRRGNTVRRVDLFENL